MKTTIATAIALAACASTQLFASNSKEDTIAFALNLQGQVSVSTSATALNAGNWSQQPTHYKTVGSKLTQQSLIKAIGVVLHGNGDGISGANYYSSKATLVLVQGELSGFFNVIPGLSNSVAQYDNFGDLDGFFDTTSDTGVSTIIPDATVTYVTLDNGRHYQRNPIDGLYPVGHFQPWGQIFVKDPANVHTSGLVCDNATFFFDLQVQECYDCFYLNSFISDSAFTYSTTGGGNAGPPCCTIPTTTHLFGKGTDRYYLTWSFDDTEVNPYLDPVENNVYTGFTGIVPTVGSVDGTLPDALIYKDPIKSGLGTPSPYEIRFTLNGILTYNWQLKLINTSDVLPDFLGTATYAANGYGFIQLTCQLITGTASITERIVNSAACCDDIAWYDSWYGIGWDGDANDLVSETDAPGVFPAGTYTTTQENVPLSLTYHQQDWVVTGPVSGY